ncbi:MAG: hypothetical protein JSS02_05065 [Planctomycetes bacterium]|nr:hypothetical protein [Planctomycetota bacterium]
MRRLSQISITSSALVLAVTLIAAPAVTDEPQPAVTPQPPEKQTDESIKPKAGNPALSKRLTYSVQYGSPKDLAAILQPHFQGEAEFRTLPASGNRSLLIAATPEAADEVVRTLALLDRPPQKIIVDVWILEESIPHEKGAAQKPAPKLLDERQLTGPVEEVSARLESLSKTDSLAYYRQLRLENLDNRENTVQVGEEKPRISGYTSTGAGGGVTPMIQQRIVGTIAAVTARLVDDQKILLEFTVRDDRLSLPEEGTQIARGTDGPIMSPDVLTTNLKGTLTVPAGQTVIASRVETDARSKRSRRQIVIAARLESAEKK